MLEVVRLTLVLKLCPKYRGSRQEVPPQGKMKLLFFYINKISMLPMGHLHGSAGLRDYTIPTILGVVCVV